MAEIEIGTNLLAIITSIITVIVGYLSGKGIIKICNRKKNG